MILSLSSKSVRTTFRLHLAFLVLVFAVFFYFSPSAFSKTAGQTPTIKKALVLATFGTTFPLADAPVNIVEKAIKEKIPGVAVFHAYTSVAVIKARTARGEKAFSLPQVLSNLSAQGYTHVAVQSLHVTPGKEFLLLQDIADRFTDLPKGLDLTTVGLPLIGSDAGAMALADALLSSTPKDRTGADAIVYVGHGTETHGGSLAYPALQAYLWKHDSLRFVGTIEGSMDLPDILASLKSKNVKKVWLVPLLTVVGDHAENDIFGDAKDSWKTQITSAGMECTLVKKGLATFPAITAIWVQHATEALNALD